MNGWKTRAGTPLRTSVLCAAVCACDAPLVATAPQDPPPPGTPTVDAQAVTTWNAIALRTTAGAPLNPPRESRAMAIASAAVFDAVNAIVPRYTPYAVRVAAGRGASTEAAVSAAAHDVLAALYPAAAASLDASYDSALAGVPVGRARDDGVAAGRTAAAALLAVRAQDHAAAPAPYAAAVTVGAWIPTPPAFAAAMEAGWGHVTQFLMDSGAQFRPGPPPQPGSDAYVRDYAEIMDLGESNSTTRTPAQTETARFWIATAPQLWNQAARRLVGARAVDATGAARAYLVLNLAGADAMIAAWDAKYAYGQWRPVTAIRSPAGGGTAGRSDTAWLPLLVTPPFPDFPAGHTAYAGAAEEVLQALFGEAPGELSITSPTAGGATHRYQNARAIADEVVNARVWGGVHWRTSATVGRGLGRQVGDVAVARAPRRLE